MDTKHGRSALSKALLLSVPLMFSPVLNAAKPIDLNHQNISILQTLIRNVASEAANPISIEEKTRAKDFNQTLHVRIQENYAGYPVWGADGVIHLPKGAKANASLRSVMSNQGSNGSMDGTMYQDIQADLANTPAYVMTKDQQAKALKHVIDNYQHRLGGTVAIKHQRAQLIVFIDKNNKAHWAYHIQFFVDQEKDGILPQKPNSIIDAKTFEVYKQWDDIKTVTSATLEGGGFGGNIKMGKLSYDGLKDHLDKLKIQRDGNTCTLENDEVTVKGYYSRATVSFTCQALDPDHNNVYWDADLEAVNDGYSPPNDALFGGLVIKNMYQKWYGVPVLTVNGKPMMLIMRVHRRMDNAYWDGKQMTFGDGITMFYPLTSLGVAAHEVSHGFTQQHSNLVYYGQSGGMNEAYSDMAAQAAEFYAFGKNSWQIGPEIFKRKDEALRYMDKPSKDCKGRRPGSWCSIDDAKQYRPGLDVHYSSGVYNRFFYILGTTPNWNVKMAFDVMVHANSNYWTSSTNFVKGACGVIKAAKDLNYDVDAVKRAFDEVKVNYKFC